MAREEITAEEAREKLNNITYLYTPNTEQLLGTINSLSGILLEKKPKLVILDGAIGQFREEYLKAHYFKIENKYLVYVCK